MSQYNIPYISNDQLSKKNQYAIEILEHNASHLELGKLLKVDELKKHSDILHPLSNKTKEELIEIIDKNFNAQFLKKYIPKAKAKA